MTQQALDLPQDDQNFIIEHVVDGYKPDEIAFLLKTDHGSRVSEETVRQFLGTEYAKNAVDMRRRIQERKAEVSREELVADLKEAKEGLKEEIQELRDANYNDISNDTMSNLISNIKLLGEFIGELQNKDDAAGGVVNVNKLEQNFNFVQAIQYMPKEEKKSIAEQLAEDPEVEDFAIIRNED